MTERAGLPMQASPLYTINLVLYNRSIEKAGVVTWIVSLSLFPTVLSILLLIFTSAV